MNEVPLPGEHTVHVVLIHHDVESRVAAVQPTVSAVVDALAQLGPSTVHEVSAQPPFTPLPPRTLCARRVRQWAIERRWSSYLGVSRRWFLSSGLLCLRLASLAIPHLRRTAERQAFIELSLTAKHELAWRRALEGGADVLVVLEDDARANAETGRRIRALIDTAMAEGGLESAYLDLAGGLSRRTLRLTRVERRHADSEVISIRRAATNTTCAYLVGREVLQRLVFTTVLRPGSARLPSDWFINACFMDAIKADERITCLHADPPPLAHGSFTGEVSSSIRA